METSVILQNINQRMSIASLNPMQMAVMSVREPKIILLAPTGSGKTIAFAIVILKNITKPSGTVQAVVLAPSRELVIQIYDVIRPIATGLKTAAFYGGHPMQAEVDSIKGAVPDIIVATPGRLLDHLTRGTLQLDKISSIVFDEYDKSLELGFHDEMKKIARRIPRKLKMTMLTSATPIAEIPDFIDMNGAVTVDYTDRTENPRARMDVVNVISPMRDKIQTLEELLLTLQPQQKTIVFVNHRESAERIYTILKKKRFPVGLYHGGLEQREREQAIDLLNNSTTPILIATDLAARGLDIDSVESIIHYHPAPSAETWTHRNGRTARVDASGTIFVITSEDESIPEFVVFDRELRPNPSISEPVSSSTATLYINAGKREKISRGDIAGFMMQQSGLKPDEVGKIVVKDHSSLVAIPAKDAKTVLATVKGLKIKNKSVKISLIS